MKGSAEILKAELHLREFEMKSSADELSLVSTRAPGHTLSSGTGKSHLRQNSVNLSLPLLLHILCICSSSSWFYVLTNLCFLPENNHLVVFCCILKGKNRNKLWF